MSFPDPAVAITWWAASGHPPWAGGIGVALALAVLSTCCYATAAVLQEREAAGRLLAQLVRRPWWWLAVAATGAGAVLHIAALASGPLSLVQPLGVLTLVLALPLGARLGGRAVASEQWRAAAAVALGLAALLTVAPHHAPAAHLPTPSILIASIAVGTAVAVILLIACRLPSRAVPVAHAAAAATCFGFASAMARAAVTAAAPVWLVAALAVLSAVGGLGLAQLAYRSGGLGAPLATQILVDPLVAVLLGITLLGEPLHLTSWRVAIGLAGLLATAAGISSLTRVPPPAGSVAPEPTPADGSTTPAADEKDLAHVVR